MPRENQVGGWAAAAALLMARGPVFKGPPIRRDEHLNDVAVRRSGGCVEDWLMFRANVDPAMVTQTDGLFCVRPPGEFSTLHHRSPDSDSERPAELGSRSHTRSPSVFSSLSLSLSITLHRPLFVSLYVSLHLSSSLICPLSLSASLSIQCKYRRLYCTRYKKKILFLSSQKYNIYKNVYTVSPLSLLISGSCLDGTMM